MNSESGGGKMKISDLLQFELRRNAALISIIGLPLNHSQTRAYTLMSALPNDKINLVRLTTDQIL
jgi:aspartokinase